MISLILINYDLLLSSELSLYEELDWGWKTGLGSTLGIIIGSYSMQFLKGMAGGFGGAKPAATPAKTSYFSSLKLE